MRILIFILLILWYLLGFFLCKSFLCNGTSKPAAKAIGVVPTKGDCDTKFMIKDGDFELIGSSPLKFKESNHSALMPDDKMFEVLNNLSKYLKDNPDKGIQITGIYHPKEKNPTTEKDLGLARAINFQKTLLVKKLKFPEEKIMSLLSQSDEQACFKDGVIMRGATISIEQLK